MSSGQFCNRNANLPECGPNQASVNEEGVNDHCHDDEESEAVAPLDALLVFTVGEVDDGGYQERVVKDDHHQDCGAADSRLVLGI